MKHILSFILFFGILTTYAQTTVMTYNIRYANNNDAEFAWKNRKENMAKKIITDNVDILCLQEVLKEQIDFLNAKLTEYAFVGVGREDGKNEGEYVPIYYKKNKFAIEKWGTKWLSDTPEIVSNTWKAACMRIATWAILKNLEDDKKIIVINTHFDHQSEIAKVNSAELINKLAFELQTNVDKIPVILCGDFNATSDEPAIKRIMRMFSNTRPKKTTQVNYSYIGFNSKEEQRSLIDFIFIRSCSATNYKIDSENYGLGQLSDHLSILCTID